MFQSKFGAPSTWALDVFTLPHNAIRAECVDLYNILESIHARSHLVTVTEIEEFTVWWTAFEIFVIEYFDFEADVLFPWAFPSNANEDDRNMSPEHLARKLHSELFLKNSLLSRKESLLDSIRQLNGTFELRRHVDIADVFQTILDEVNQFVPSLLEYFHMQERYLPAIVSQLYSEFSRDLVTRKYISYIKKGESPHMNLVLLTEWMDDNAREKWVRNNLKGYSRLMHKRWEKRCYKTHGDIAYKFHRRLLRTVRNVAASRLRRRTEFGEEIEDISFGSLPSHIGSIRSLSLAGGSRSPQRPTHASSRDLSTSRETSRARGRRK